MKWALPLSYIDVVDCIERDIMKLQNAPTIIIEIEGGKILDMITNCDLYAVIVNHDVNDIPEKDLRIFPVTKSRTVKVSVSSSKIDKSIGFVDTAIASLSNVKPSIKKLNHIHTGWFEREHERGHKSGHTHIHLFNTKTGNCVCGYKPHKTMCFKSFSTDIRLSSVECPRCIQLMSTRHYAH